LYDFLYLIYLPIFCYDWFYVLSAPEFDFSELEKLFSLNVPKPADAGKSGGKGKSAGSKTDRVTLVLFYTQT